MANVSIENRLNLYSNYLDDPCRHRLPDECSHENQQIPDGKCRLQTIYDDNSVQAVQVREIFGIELITVSRN
jgi:hypothetical protein